MEVCVAQAVPARKPYGCLFPIQKAWEDRKILTPAHTVSLKGLSTDRPAIAGEHPSLSAIPSNRAHHKEPWWEGRAAFMWCSTLGQNTLILAMTLLSNSLIQCQLLPQNTRESEALALGLDSGVPLSAMGWEWVCPCPEWLPSGTSSEGRADPHSKLQSKASSSRELI